METDMETDKTETITIPECFLSDKDIEHMFQHQMSRFKLRPALCSLKGKKDLVGVEIGVFMGINALTICKFLDIKNLYLIDPYDTVTLKAAYPYCAEEALGNIFKIMNHALFKHQDKCKLFKGYSTNLGIVTQIPNDLDFVYIDGGHDYISVIKDLTHYFSKVKKGGIIGGHDWVEDIPDDMEVRSAVMDFFESMGHMYRKTYEVHTGDRDWYHIKD